MIELGRFIGHVFIVAALAFAGLWALGTCSTARADGLTVPDGATVERNPWRKGEFRIESRDGRTIGTIRENPYREGEFEIRSRDGRRQGTIRENPYRKGEFEIRGN